MKLELLKKQIRASIDTKEKLISDDALMNEILALSEKCAESLRLGGKILFCGNGGSFADAQHLSAEFTSRFLFDRPGLPSLALGTNTSAMTAIGNDYGYDNVFARELQAIATPADVLIAITTSGNSENIIKVLQIAKQNNIFTVVLTGAGMGKLPSDIQSLHIPSLDTARIQECHILVGHIICGLVEADIFSELRT